MALAAQGAGAATYSWLGTYNNQWSLQLSVPVGVANNWSIAGLPGASDVASFYNATPAVREVSLTGNPTASAVYFERDSNYHLFGNPLSVGTILCRSRGAVTNPAVGQTLDCNVNIRGADGGINVEDSGTTLTINGALSDGVAGLGITKTGRGTLVLNSSTSASTAASLNLELGASELTGGTLTVGSSNSSALAVGDSLKVSGGSRLLGASGATVSVAESDYARADPTAFLIVTGAGSELSGFRQLRVGELGKAGSLRVDTGAKASATDEIYVGFGASGIAAVTGGSSLEVAKLIVGGMAGTPGQAGTTPGAGEVRLEGAGTAGRFGSVLLGGLDANNYGGTGKLTVTTGAFLETTNRIAFLTTGATLVVDRATASTPGLDSNFGATPTVLLTNTVLGGVATPALVITQPNAAGISGFAGVIRDGDADAGGLVKRGPGMQAFSGHNLYTGGTTVEAGVLRLDVANALSSAGPVIVTGGELQIGSVAQQVGAFTLSSGSVTGAASTALSASSATLLTGTVQTRMTVNGTLTKSGAGTVTINGRMDANNVSILGGILESTGDIVASSLSADGQLRVRGIVQAAVTMSATSRLTATGPLTVLGSVDAQGTVLLGAQPITFVGAGTRNLRDILISGGSITSSSAINLATLAGYGTVAAPISGPSNGSIRARDGGLTLGTADVADSFAGYAGRLEVDIQQISLKSGAVSSIGETTLAGGTLASQNGVGLRAGARLEGYGLISGPFDNGGTVQAATTQGRQLRFSGPVTGPGTYAGAVQFEDVFSPGNGPVRLTSDATITLTSGATLRMQLGGTVLGSGYDQLRSTRSLQLGGKLEVLLINGFSLAAGQAFDLLDWQQLTGSFSTISLPALGSQLQWNIRGLYATGILSVGMAGDYNFDGLIDAADYTVWADLFGQTGSYLVADGNGDGRVDAADYTVWADHFGAGTPPGGTATVPEPAASANGLLLAGMMGTRRRRRA